MRRVALAQVQLEVLFLEDALVLDPEVVVEQRRLGSPGPRSRSPAGGRSRGCRELSSSAPSVSSVRVRSAGSIRSSHHLPKSLLEARQVVFADGERRPPWRGRRSVAAGPGACLVTRSSASRRCRPGMERPEPLSARRRCPGAKAMVGRWNFSLMRPARMPITPWCQFGFEHGQAGAGCRGRCGRARSRPLPACRPRWRGVRG